VIDNSVRRTDDSLRRILDILVAFVLLLLLSPLIVAIAAAIRMESPGPAFYRCRRVGFRGRELMMMKFRKMHHGASGAALTAVEDERFTQLGRFLASSKVDEIPQLWNVLVGGMSLVGPRPEDERFVGLHREEFARILTVRPGITGLSQLAFAREAEILDEANRTDDYTQRILPQKVRLDCFYADHRSLRMNVSILFWTVVAVILRLDVAVNRANGRLGIRARPALSTTAAENR